MPTATVAVAGQQSGEAPPTWGQSAILRILEVLRGRSSDANLGTSATLPPGTDVRAALDWIRHIVTTFEALRTRFVDRDGTVIQVLDGTGSVEVELIDTADAEPGLVADVVTRLREEPFPIADRWPVRFAVLVRDGSAEAIAVACSHAASDAFGMRVLGAVLGSPGTAIEPSVQPLDQAAFERSPAGLMVDSRARAHWRTQLMAMPHTLFPGRSGAPHEGSRFWFAIFDSPVIAEALPHLAARYGRNTSAVLYAALSAALAANAGTVSCPLGMVAAGRARPGARNAVGSYAQTVPMTMPVAGRSWTELVHGGANAALTALRHGSYGPDTRELTMAEVQERRGVRLDLSLWFNDTRATAVAGDQPFDPAAPPPAGVADWCHRTDDGDSTVYVYASGPPDATRLYLGVDTTRLSLTQAENLLADVEGGLVEAAGTGNRAAVPATVRWWPSTDDFVQVDNSWVNLRSVERLVREVGDCSSVRVSLEQGRLVARLSGHSPGAPVIDLRQACMRRLTAFPDAMVPHRYLPEDGPA